MKLLSANGTSTMHLLASCLAAASCAVAFAQTATQLDGPPPLGSFDANPANPANWNVNYETVYDGLTKWSGWDYENSVPVAVVWTNVWGSGVWKRNGVVLPVQPVSAMNSTQEVRDVDAESTGTITRKMKWISPYPKPNKVLVSVSGIAEYGVSYGHFRAAKILKNWKNDPETATEYGGFLESGESSNMNLPNNEQDYVWLDVDPSTGVAVYTKEQSSVIKRTGGYGTLAMARADSFSIAFAEKAIGIIPFANPTFYKDPVTGLRTKNSMENIKFREMDTVCYYHELDGGEFHWDINNARFYKEQWGYWPNPYHEWSANTQIWSDTLFTEYPSIETDYTWDFSVFEMADSHEEEYIDLSVTDVDATGKTWAATLAMRVHPPAENWEQISDIRINNPWEVCSEEILVLPGEATTVNVDIFYSKVVAAYISYSTSSVISPGFIKLAEVEFARSIGGELNVSTSITTLTSYPMHQLNFPVETTQWLRGRSFYRLRKMKCDAYDVNGYYGVEETETNYYHSKTRASAEVNDFEVEVAFRAGF